MHMGTRCIWEHFINGLDGFFDMLFLAGIRNEKWYWSIFFVCNFIQRVSSHDNEGVFDR
jgi:hypothetical protein